MNAPTTEAPTAAARELGTPQDLERWVSLLADIRCENDDSDRIRDLDSLALWLTVCRLQHLTTEERATAGEFFAARGMHLPDVTAN